ncbi:MAG: cyclic pyranopterin monophosphate synthase MoaC [Dehalococcoidia bacterium]
MAQIFTDGAYNPGLDRGGWAAVVVEDGQKHVFSGTTTKTTSNRMEITAALEGVLSTPQSSEVAVFTDSQYLFGSMTRGWQRRANLDLWERLDEARGQRTVRWEWIRGDDANPFHQEAHDMATSLAGGGDKPRSARTKREAGSARVRMVDVGDKPVTRRRAEAAGRVVMQASTLELIRAGGLPKGDVLAAAQLAGIMAAKRTPDLLPLCHPLLVEDVRVEFELNEEAGAVEITASVVGDGKTGFEMEALTAVSVSALTIYDMTKSVDPAMRLEGIRLVRKSGGKSGTVELGP